jgi:hypothetical protein
MRQQRYEDALRRISARAQATFTAVADLKGVKRQREMLYQLSVILKDANEALEEADHDRQDPDHR